TGDGSEDAENFLGFRPIKKRSPFEICDKWISAVRHFSFADSLLSGGVAFGSLFGGHIACVCLASRNLKKRFAKFYPGAAFGIVIWLHRTLLMETAIIR